MITFTTVCCHWYGQWRKEFVYKKQLLLLLFISFFLVNSSFAQSANIDQWRKTFQVWTGGNINGQNSDYYEGQSVPYRAILSNLQPNTSTQIVISFQITKGNDVRHAIDYITSYNRSVPELTDAMVLDGSGLTAGAPKSTYLLPAAAQPSQAKSIMVSVPYDGAPVVTSALQPYTSASLLPGSEKSITIWGGAGATVTDARYYYDNGYTGEGDINAADEDAYIIITLNPGNSSTAVLAWGGHIASRTEWGFLSSGVPRSATGISGSPYHMRLEFWANPYKQIGQQDASMQLDFVPPPCNIQATEAGTTTIVANNHSFDCAAPQITVSNLNPGFSQTWTVTGPATINGTGGAKTLTSSSPSITLTHTGGCGTIKVSVVINYGLEEATKTCEFSYSVADNIPPTVTVTSTKDLGCNAENPSSQFDAPQIGDNCGTPTLVSGYPQTGAVQESGCMRSLTRTWRYTDACGNTAEASQTLTWIADLAGPTVTIAENKTLACNTTNAAENFDTPDVTEGCSAATLVAGYPQTGQVVVTNCGRSLTRTWKYRDNCGNETTKTQTLHWTMDTENPTFKASSNSKVAGNDLGCNPDNINGSFAALSLADFEDNCGLKAISVKSTTDNATVGCVHSRTRTWVITDNCDNSVEVSQTLTWTVDIQAPWIRETSSSKILAIDLGCNPEDVNGRFATLTTADFDDNCSVKSVNIQSTSDGAVVGCTHSRTRTWEITDNCDNKSTVSLTLTWTADKEKPTVSVASTKPLGCNPSATTFDVPDTWDGCSSVTPVEGYPQTSAVTEEGCNRSQMKTWRFKDACGNLSDIISQTLTWTVDNTGPVVEVAESKSLGCNPENPSGMFDHPQVSDGCSQATLANGYPQSGDVQVSGCNRSQMRTWKYEDACGNHTYKSQTITWTVDTQAPIFNLNGEAVGTGPVTSGYQRVQKLTVEVACDAEYSTNPAFQPADNCGIASSSSAPTETIEAANCATGFKQIVTRKWEATDNCGNKTLLIYEIKVKCCEVLCTYTQGAYGNAGGKACIGEPNGPKLSTKNLIQHSLNAWGGTMRIGTNAKYIDIRTSEWESVMMYLPGGGGSYSFKSAHKNGYISDPAVNFQGLYTKKAGKNYRIDNTLLAQTITLGLNIGIRENLSGLGLQGNKYLVTVDPVNGCGTKTAKTCTYDPVTGALINDPNTYKWIDGAVVNAIAGPKTVGGLFAFANRALAGESVGVSLTQIASVVDAINNAFDECKLLVGYSSTNSICQQAPVTYTVSTNTTERGLESELSVNKLQVLATPNPYNDKVRFTIESPISGQGSLEVYNLLGQKVETVYQGYIMAGRGQAFDYNVPLTNRTTLIYLLKVGDQQVTGKLLSRK